MSLIATRSGSQASPGHRARRRPGRHEKLEGVPVRLGGLEQLHHRGQDPGVAVGHGAVSRESLQALAENKEPGFTRRDEDLVCQLSTQILGEHFVSDETFAVALAEFGEQGVVDLIGSLVRVRLQ